ncbi:hypothetical protein I3842_15G018100 [Carya illinoinensis]|uniref:Uncharacterized protein n=1 Tax=Carya illinoinensis TaxID=32201 RepID=A0A922D6Y7_CARIL|nr:hypothetical protein I3842_15G018100 [Carya illinoinensis]
MIRSYSVFYFEMTCKLKNLWHDFLIMNLILLPLCSVTVLRRVIIVAYSPTTGDNSGYGLATGYNSGYGPSTGNNSGYGPTTGYNSGYDPTTGNNSGYGPTMGYISGYGPATGYSSGLCLSAHLGDRVIMFCLDIRRCTTLARGLYMDSVLI